MSNTVRNLQPADLWNHFANLNEVPRPSKKEERVIQFMLDFGNKLGLETSRDDIGNVIIRKPATPGMEDRMGIVLQGHIDMVHQKNADTNFDFDTEGIKMFVEGDWVKAEGTTLGADNGIGVAAIMAILSSKTIAHPAIDALFTIDEETGMTGALGLKGGLLKGRILLNLDTEDDDELTIGCAGGIDINILGSYDTQPIDNQWIAFDLSLTGLTGGHSGMDIHLGRGNANKLMNRLLYSAAEKFEIKINEMHGGSVRNAIPRECFSTIWVAKEKAASLKEFMAAQIQIFASEHSVTDPNLKLEITENKDAKSAMSSEFQRTLLRTIYACPNGIYRMSPSIGGLVQTSNNLACIEVRDGSYSIQCLTRSSVDSEKYDLANAIKAVFELLGADIKLEGSYPGWKPEPDAAIIKIMSGLYQELFGEKAHVNAVHAGLECGILGTNYPDMEMISFGPNIKGAHSPDERCQISSVQKFWKFLLKTLENIPVAA